jgi:predicted alpha/beta-fold hydrolase
LRQEIQAEYPQSFIALAGISAGSGQLMTFLGSQAKHLGINVAAASLCTAYDLSTSFENLQQRHPTVNKILTKLIRKYFLTVENQKVLASFPEALENCQRASTIGEFVEASAPFADGASHTPAWVALSSAERRLSHVSRIYGSREPEQLLRRQSDALPYCECRR